MSQERVDKTKAEQDLLIESAKLEIKTFKEESIREAKLEIANIVMEVSRKVTKKVVNEDNNREIINQSVKELL